jgi:hypothetical protein
MGSSTNWVKDQRVRSLVFKSLSKKTNITINISTIYHFKKKKTLQEWVDIMVSIWVDLWLNSGGYKQVTTPCGSNGFP